MNADPYLTPAAYPPPPADLSAVSAEAIQQLAATRPWVRFISVMTFIGAGFMLLGAAGMAVMGVVGGAAGAKLPPTSPNHQVNQFAGAMGFGIAALYVVLAVVYLFPGIKLWKYANAITTLTTSGRNHDLVTALDQQRSFWKFMGIMIIAMLILYVLVIIGAVAIAVIGAAANAH